MLLGSSFSIPSSHDKIPNRRRHTKVCVFILVVVIHVSSLETAEDLVVEVCVVEEVVHGIVHHVPKDETGEVNVVGDGCRSGDQGDDGPEEDEEERSYDGGEDRGGRQ